MSTLYISHGAPTLAMEPGATGEMLAKLALTLPRPRAILAVSAHWDTHYPRVSAVEKPETIHDFGGFPPAMYAMQYAAEGSPALAQQVDSALAGAGISVAQDPQRGLDHGAWVPLKLMYPLADIPVSQLSIQSHAGPLAHYKIGQAIGALQDEGVMILCSGAITHNLHDFFTMQRDAPLLPYVAEFADWMAEKAVSRDIDALLNYRKLAPNAAHAHPQEDHLVPLFVALGAARGRMTRYQPENTFGILAMDTYVWNE